MTSQSLLDFVRSLPSLETIQQEIARRQRLRELSQTEQSLEARRARCRSLYGFVREFWYVVEPSRKLVGGWVLEDMCAHLEAVTRGEITRLLINVPPGFMKSLLLDVFWPAWEWGPMGMAHLRYVAFSYSSTLTERDNARFRAVIRSPEYVELFGDVFRLTKTANERIVNDSMGFKVATSVGGLGTGERGDRVLLDDPHNVVEGESDAIRGNTVRWFREAMSNRLNDQDSSAIVVIMQRVHEEDVSGTILSKSMNYVHFCVPMEYDPQRAIRNSWGWQDRRVYDGELAWPERFPAEVVAQLRTDIGPYAWSSQYAQSPAPRGGGIFKRADWGWWPPEKPEVFDALGHPISPLSYPPFRFVLASLDTAMTESEENDWSALTIWGVWQNSDEQYRIILMQAARWRREFHALIHGVDDAETGRHEPGVIDLCRARRVDRLLVEAKVNGFSVAQEISRLCRGEEFGVHLAKRRGDLVARAHAVQHLFSNGLISRPDRRWADDVVTEMETFPKAAHDDYVSSAIMALEELRRSGLALLASERQEEINRERIPLGERAQAIADRYGVA